MPDVMDNWRCCFCGGRLGVIISTSRRPSQCLGKNHPEDKRHVLCDCCEMWIKFEKLSVDEPITKEIQAAMLFKRPRAG